MMVQGSTGKSAGRSGTPDRPEIVSVQPFSDPEELERELDAAARRARFTRNERWENYRQNLVIASFTGFAVLLFVALLFSVIAVFTSAEEAIREIARWVLETLVGGFIAGIIGLWAVKSFEK